MNHSFEYIDIILLAMIAGFIFLRLRGILGKRTGFDVKTTSQFEKVLNNVQNKKKTNLRESFDDEAQKDFLKGAEIAYETIITDFSDNDNKLTSSKPLLSKKIYEQFDEALKERSKRNHYAEITFIGVNSAKIKEHKEEDKIGYQTAMNEYKEAEEAILKTEKNSNPESEIAVKTSKQAASVISILIMVFISSLILLAN